MCRMSDLRPNQIIAHRRIKKIGKKIKNRTPKAIASPGRTVIRLVKNTYLAQNNEVPGNPIVTKTAKTEKTHSNGVERAMPPI